MLLFAVAAELYGRERGVTFAELLSELDGEDLDRMLEAVALVKRRRSTSPGSPDDLWIRAAEPDCDDRRKPPDENTPHAEYDRASTPTGGAGHAPERMARRPGEMSSPASSERRRVPVLAR